MSAWATLHAAYLAADLAERDFDAAHIDSALPPVPRAAWDESNRLADARHSAEAALMAQPCPDGLAFARKYLVAHGGGRDTDCWDSMMEAEAQRLLAGADPHRAWLDERDAAIEAANRAVNDEAHSAALDAFTALEDQILRTPAETIAGQTVRLLVLAQMLGQGHSLDGHHPEIVWSLIEDTASMLGSRTLASMEYPPLTTEADNG
jgi:hypothetical protein